MLLLQMKKVPPLLRFQRMMILGAMWLQRLVNPLPALQQCSSDKEISKDVDTVEGKNDNANLDVLIRHIYLLLDIVTNFVTTSFTSCIVYACCTLLFSAKGI